MCVHCAQVLDARKAMDKVFGKAQPTTWKKSKINVLWVRAPSLFSPCTLADYLLF